MSERSGQDVRKRLTELLEISKDPQYDRYLNQMMRDLESGKATPAQVEQEALRTYEIYKQRMGISQTVNDQGKAAHSVEFKVGIHLFSMIGAVFVLVAFVIFSFNFLSGLWQGICLYVAAFTLIILSELLLYRRMPAFSHVLTGIGVGSIYIAGIVNYLVLHTFNGIVAMDHIDCCSRNDSLRTEKGINYDPLDCAFRVLYLFAFPWKLSGRFEFSDIYRNAVYH